MKEVAINSVSDIEAWFEDEPMPIIALPTVRATDSPDDRHSRSQAGRFNGYKMTANGENLPINHVVRYFDDTDMAEGFGMLTPDDDSGQNLETIMNLIG